MHLAPATPGRTPKATPLTWEHKVQLAAVRRGHWSGALRFLEKVQSLSVLTLEDTAGIQAAPQSIPAGGARAAGALMDLGAQTRGLVSQQGLDVRWYGSSGLNVLTCCHTGWPIALTPAQPKCPL